MCCLSFLIIGPAAARAGGAVGEADSEREAVRREKEEERGARGEKVLTHAYSIHLHTYITHI